MFRKSEKKETVHQQVAQKERKHKHNWFWQVTKWRIMKIFYESLYEKILIYIYFFSFTSVDDLLLISPIGIPPVPWLGQGFETIWLLTVLAH